MVIQQQLHCTVALNAPQGFAVFSTTILANNSFSSSVNFEQINSHHNNNNDSTSCSLVSTDISDNNLIHKGFHGIDLNV